MSSTPRTLIVFGSGPGIGRSVAVNFASHGFTHVILLSRNQQRLEDDKGAVIKAASAQDVKVDTLIVDLSSQDSIKKALAEIDGLAKSVEVVFFNGARVAVTPLFGTRVEEIENDFKLTTIGLYLVAQWAIPKLQATASAVPTSKPSLLVTSGLLHVEPLPNLFSLSLVKTAQRNLVQSLHQVYNSARLHIGLVLVGGYVSDHSKNLNPTSIAEHTWEFFDGKGRELEVTLPE